MTMGKTRSRGVAYEVGGKGLDPTIGKIARDGADASEGLSAQTSPLAALLGCNTSLSKGKNPESGEEKWEPKGNSSETPFRSSSRQ